MPVLGSLAFFGCGGNEEPGSSSAADDAANAPSSEASDEIGARSGCEEVGKPQPHPDGGAQRPTERLAPGQRYRVVLQTNCGRITFRLDQRTSPKTAASFAALVRAGFFDDTVFHRIVPGFVIQGGDPTGTGTGGPGYSTRDVPPGDTVYTKGVVAMAKTAVEAPGTAGSQFYIVTAPDAGLPPEYAVLGEVTAGLRVVEAIGELGAASAGGEGRPLLPVVIRRARLLTG